MALAMLCSFFLLSSRKASSAQKRRKLLNECYTHCRSQTHRTLLHSRTMWTSLQPRFQKMCTLREDKRPGRTAGVDLLKCPCSVCPSFLRLLSPSCRWAGAVVEWLSVLARQR